MFNGETVGRTMRVSGLKITIAGVLVMLLATALVLGNVVTVVFWQKSLRKSLEGKTNVVICAVERLFAGYVDKGQRITGADLQEIAGLFETASLNISYYNGSGAVSAFTDPEGEKREQIARISGMTQKDKKIVYGRSWGLINFGGTTLIMARPLDGGGVRNSAVAVSVGLGSVYESIKKDLKIVIVYLVVNLLVLFVIGFFRMVSLVIKPIERMVRVSESYKLSDGITFSGDGAGSEFGQLSMALNSMLLRIEMDREKLRKTVESLESSNRELVETQKEMILAEKHASVGRLSAGLAHEIGNPLGIIQGYIELLQNNDLDVDEREQFSARALEEMERVNRLIRQLLDFARTSPMAMKEVNVGSVLEELVQVLFFRKNDEKIVFELKGEADGYRVIGDENSLKQVFLNILLNGIDGVDARDRKTEGNIDGKIEISLHRAPPSGNEGSMIEVVIRDNGAGIEESILNTVFDPFVTTKEPGKGTGLGLFVSHAIIQAHNGRIWIESEPCEGTSVHVILPEYESDETRPDMQ